MRRILILCMIIVISSLLCTTNEGLAQTFNDVDSKHPSYEAIEKLAELGIISSDAENFNPDNLVTRGQLAKMMAIALKLDTSNVKDPNFKDVPKGSGFYPYVAALVEEGIISGYPDGTFGVNKPVTKAHLAKFIVNGFDMPIRAEYVQPFQDVTPGTEANTYAATLHFYRITWTPKYNPKSNARRYVVASFIYDAMQKKQAIDNQVEVKLAHNALGKQQEYYTFTGLENAGKTDILKQVFVLMPAVQERGFYAAMDVKNNYIQYEVDENGQVAHLSVVNKVEPKYKLYYGIGYVNAKWADGDIEATTATYENVSNPQLPSVKGTKGIFDYGRLAIKADLYAAHGEVALTSIYKQTVTYSNGTETVNYLRNIEGAQEISAELLIPIADGGVKFDLSVYPVNKNITVEGPQTYTFSIFDSANEGELITDYTFKDVGIYKVTQNGKMILAAELFEENGQVYGRRLWDLMN